MQLLKFKPSKSGRTTLEVPKDGSVIIVSKLCWYMDACDDKDCTKGFSPLVVTDQPDSKLSPFVSPALKKLVTFLH